MNILVLGCGYLGSKVAHLWKKKGNFITATTRSAQRLDSLTKVCQKSVILKSSDEENLADLIEENELILITIAADNTDEYEEAYLKTSERIGQVLKNCPKKKRIIYTSSTSIYGDHNGQWVDESTTPKPKDQRAEILLQTEKSYLNCKKLGHDVSILRLAGLYGPERELSKRLQDLKGKTLAGTGEEYTNMVHLEDAVHAVEYAFHHHFDGIYNVCDDDHPTRKVLYAQVAEQMGLDPVKWDPTHTPFSSGNKRISNHKIKSAGFAFLYPHRVID